MKIITRALLLTIIFSTSCKIKVDNSPGIETFLDSLTMIEIKEAREDSLEMAMALSKQAFISKEFFPLLETEPVGSEEGEDAADDPAIWYNRDSPGKSLVLGTDKKSGVYVYDLKGKVLQFREIGMINNIDLRDGFQKGEQEIVLVAGSNRSNNCITLMAIDKQSGSLSDSLLNIPSGVDEVYGLCCYISPIDQEFYVFVNGKGGMLEQWRITGNPKIGGELVRSFSFSSQPEGMVADDRKGVLYAGVEQEGIFRINAEAQGDSSLVKLQGSDESNPGIAYDIEGLAIFSDHDRDFLIASSQGNFSYAIFDVTDEPKYITSFILSDKWVDGVEETDGLDVVSLPLNKSFPKGLLVVQDGHNTDNAAEQSQNFKYVSYKKISNYLKKK